MTFRVRPGTLERRLSARPMPPPDTWQIVPEGGSAMQPNGGLEVVGEAQLASPAIDVEPNSTVIVDLPLSVSEGSVSFGALDETHQWLAQRSGGGEIRFNTGNNKRFSLLVQSASSEVEPRKRFRVKSGSIWLQAGTPYVDKLTLCREWADKGLEKPAVCN